MFSKLVRGLELLVGSKGKISTNYELMTNNSKGQSLMELVVVVAVMVIVLGALVFATIVSLRNAHFAKNQIQATKLAQEALERVRTGRDRNLPVTIPDINVTSWNGSLGSGSFWDYHISGDCEREQGQISTKCYFTVSPTGELQNIGFSQGFFPQGAEKIPLQKPIFQRVVMISDDLNDDKNFNNDDYKNAKKVTALVIWADISGQHESRLTSILRNLNP